MYLLYIIVVFPNHNPNHTLIFLLQVTLLTLSFAVRPSLKTTGFQLELLCALSVEWITMTHAAADNMQLLNKNN